MSEILEFISNGGIKERVLDNSTEWENNPNKEKYIVMVDSYEFRSNGMLGYIGFYHEHVIQIWGIKSLKLSMNRTNTMAIALSQAGFKLPSYLDEI